ncbi:MAG: putative toxin-antitoxin system toxin component, PIN family [Bacteroidaceae bacterium]|nr:putative toxin-antitoxin system toxin component, PIN family [Bacteroidaceae bacterium]
MRFYAVLDTNVLVSYLLTGNHQSAVWKIMEYVRNGTIVPLTHPEIITEYTEVLKRRKFNFKEEDIRTLINAFTELGLACERVNTVVSLPDPNDQVFFDVTCARDDAYLVTGNLKHFVRNGHVVSPAEMLQIISLSEFPLHSLCESGLDYSKIERRELISRFDDVVRALYQNALETGVSDMSIEEINEEIRLAREEHHRKFNEA